jgi:hypothetical protein
VSPLFSVSLHSSVVHERGLQPLSPVAAEVGEGGQTGDMLA